MNEVNLFKSVIFNSDMNFVIDLHNYFIFKLSGNEDLITNFKFIRNDSTIPNLKKAYELFMNEYQRDIKDNPNMILSNPNSLDMPSPTKYYPNPVKNRLYQDFPIKPNVNFVEQIIE